MHAAKEVKREEKAAAANHKSLNLSLYVENVTKQDSVDAGTRQVVELFGRTDYCLISTGVGLSESP